MSIAICKVCEIVDKNPMLKECEWCGFCSAFICKECEPNLFKRGMAYIKLKKKLNL